VWKSLDWDLMDLLEKKGWIVEARTRAKSVVLTEHGERLARESLRKHFGRATNARPTPDVATLIERERDRWP
jgi:hypothetical protein